MTDITAVVGPQWISLASYLFVDHLSSALTFPKFLHTDNNNGLK